MGVRRESGVLIVCCVFAALIASPAMAQTVVPNAAPAASSGPASVPDAAATGTGCNTIPKPASAGGASIVQATGESLQHKSWQPKGGGVQFAVRSFVPVPPAASVVVCFRWKSASGSKQPFIQVRPSRLDLDSDGKLLKVTAAVPSDLGPRPNDIAMALPLVPLAEVRILAIDNAKKEAAADNARKEAAADVTTEIGITYPWAGILFALATMILGFVALNVAANWRLTHQGILKANWLLRIISTPSGFASLSQLQILLWTFVVAVSAVYVMALSGELVQITEGTLVLLGIAGAAGIAAKAHSESQGATAEAAATAAAKDKTSAEVVAAQKAATPAPADPTEAARIAAETRQAAADANAAAIIAARTRAKADAMKDPPPTQVPRWSDLLVNESVKPDGAVTREIDVARFQMLLFTLITAAFVLMSVVTTYVIPEISTGFLTLMGISNGVYMGSKIAQRS